MEHIELPAYLIRKLAVDAETTPTSVRNFLGGKSMKPILRDRIARALERAGIILGAGNRTTDRL